MEKRAQERWPKYRTVVPFVDDSGISPNGSRCDYTHAPTKALQKRLFTSTRDGEQYENVPGWNLDCELHWCRVSGVWRFVLVKNPLTLLRQTALQAIHAGEAHLITNGAPAWARAYVLLGPIARLSEAVQANADAQEELMELAAEAILGVSETGGE